MLCARFTHIDLNVGCLSQKKYTRMRHEDECIRGEVLGVLSGLRLDLVADWFG